MVFTIKKNFLTWYMLDENKNTIAKIKSKQFWGPARKIMDSDNRTIFTTDIINKPVTTKDCNNTDIRKYVILKNDKPVVTASLIFEKYPEKTTSQTMILNPPHVVEMQLETPYGIWMVKRQKDNGIIIYQNEQQIGKISRFFSFKKQSIELWGKYNIAIIAGLYMLAEYMMHENDLIIV